MIKKCINCNKEYNGHHHSIRCPECSKIYLKECDQIWRIILQISNRMIVDIIKSELGCMICHNTDIHPLALDFHHVGVKTYRIAHLMSQCKMNKLLDEITKCIVVCSNCHRVISFERDIKWWR